MDKLLVAMIMVVSLAFISNTTFADPDMLQDVCVADLASGLKVNGFPCKSGAISANDFFSDKSATIAPTNNLLGSITTTTNVNQIPVLGISIARIDFGPNGLNSPHTHPRATGILYVLEGNLDVGFITTANVLVSKTIEQGDVFVFPKGLVHFQKNSSPDPASVIVAYNSQLAGNQAVAATLFTSKPPVSNVVLAQAFQVTTRQVDQIRSKLTSK